MDINKKIVEDVLAMYANRAQLGNIREELVELIADAINCNCPNDDTCPCWLAGCERGLERSRI